MPLLAALDVEIARTDAGIQAGLVDFDPIQTPQAWHRMLQGAEELINLVMEPWEDEALHLQFVMMPLAQAATLRSDWVKVQIAARYDDGMEERVIQTLQVMASLSFACQQHGYPLALASVGEAAGYLQSVRRRWLALFYIMPKACRGSTIARTAHDLFPLVTLAEFAGGPMTNLAQMAMMARVFDDYTVTSDGAGVKASRDAVLLDPGGFDSERVSVLDMIEFGKVAIPVPVKGASGERRLLSRAEVLMQIGFFEAAFAEFNLAGSTFGDVQRLIAPLLTGPEDYVVSIPVSAFEAALQFPGALTPARLRTLLIFEGRDYTSAINSYQPFVQIDDLFVSNLNLLTRFLNDYKTIALSPQKRFQIRSGFIFEKKVREVLEAAGFAVKDITRIDRSEFDVVTTKSGAIHNFQCKNTFIDTRLIDTDPKRYARLNGTLVRSYRRAIKKELKREHLLTAKLGMPTVRHYVVSRFPVLTDDADIIPFTRLADVASTL
ncbi:MAG: hypothetical protein IE912_02660 [Brevundimonas diminuta]|nr:hypothetical protein [Brevundimonas diminuta]MBD3817804.1 hypothetical protein [Brevundimonas diminuta]